VKLFCDNCGKNVRVDLLSKLNWVICDDISSAEVELIYSCSRCGKFIKSTNVVLDLDETYTYVDLE